MIDLILEQRSVQLVVHGATDPGMQRAENQDHFLVADLSTGENGAGMVLSPSSETGAVEPSPEIQLGPKGALILVADGMGGAAAGSVASKMAAGWIYEELVESWSVGRDSTPERFIIGLRDAVTATNAKVYQQSARYPQYRGMGTTVTAVGVLGGFLFLAQVGDSRAYLVRSGVATQLTRDQSLVQELIDAGAMSEDEAEASEHRNVILQALGVAAEVQVDLTYQELRRGDTLVICSDGLVRTVQREEIAQVVGGPDPLIEVCDRLVALANQRGGPDNVTVVVARVDGPGLEPPRAEDRVERRGYQL